MASSTSASVPAASAETGDPRTAWRVDLSVAALVVFVLAWSVLLTPAFTDFEVEAEPALQAFAAGDLAEGVRRLPLYGMAVVLMAPFAWLSQQLGGGDLSLFRAVALPGAIGMIAFAVLAGAWLRAADRPRREQLAAVLLIATSPVLSHSWQLGHPEEALVAALAIAGVLAATREGDRWAIAAGALAGLAAGSKLWAIVLVPVAIAAAPTVRAQIRVTAAAALAGIAALLPTWLAMRDQLASTVQSTGGDVFTVGNLWWFLGTPNPAWEEAAKGETVRLFSTENSPRLGPEFIAGHSHELIVIGALALAAAWWWRNRELPAGVDRTASVLTLVAAVLWWRALPDPWFQPYYLTGAIVAMVLMDARRGRLPIAAAIAWAAFWLLSVQNAPGMGLTPDVRSALSLSWTIPLGIWLVVRALRPTK